MKHILSFFLIALLTIAILPAQILNWDYQDMLTDTQEAGANPDMAIDVDGNIHVSFWNSISDRLGYAKRDKATHKWTIEYPDINNYGGYKSAIVLDANQKVHIAYYTNLSGEAYLNYTTNKSGSWISASVADTMKLGQYGINSIYKQGYQLSVDIALQANGNPFIACFDASTDFDFNNLNCPYFNDDLNIFYAYKSGNNWLNGHTGFVLNTSGTNGICNGLNDRYGEFLQLVPANNGGFHIFTNSFFNHEVIKFKSNGTNFNQWTITKVDSAERTGSGITLAAQTGPWNAYKDITVARFAGSDSLYMMYAYSEMYGQVTGNANNFYFTKVKHETLGTPSASLSFHKRINTPTQVNTPFSKFTITPYTPTNLIVTYYNSLTGGIFAAKVQFAGQQFLGEDTVVAAGFATGSSMCSGMYGDSIFLLVHDIVSNRLMLSSKAIAAISTGVSNPWLWEIATKVENRANTIASQVQANANGDVLHVVFDEREEKQLYYGTKSGAGAWAYTKLGNPKAGDVAMTLKSGNPYIAYIQLDNYSLKGTYKSGANWLTDNIASGGIFNHPSLLAIGNQLHIIYNDAQTNELRYATGTAGGTWTNSLIDSIGNFTGKEPTIAADGNGGLHVAYLDISTQELKYAYKASGGVWALSTLTLPSQYECNSPEIQVDGNNKPFIAFMDALQKKIFVLSPNTNNIWQAEMAVDLQNNNQNGNPLKFRIDMNDRLWILYNYPSMGIKEMRLSRKDPVNGLWYAVSVNNNQGEIAESFDFNMPKTDFYIFGKKNQLENKGLAYLFAANGISTDITQLALQQNLLATCYPNPATDNVIFQCQNPCIQSISIQIFDINGKQVSVITENKAAAGEWKKSLDISLLSKGVYFCKWQVGEQSFMQKLIK